MRSRLFWMALAIVMPAFALRLQVERTDSAANLPQSAMGVKQHKLAVGDLCKQIYQPSHAEYNLRKPTATYYSQIGQDSRLAKIMTNSSGFFLESGAADGETNSNSLYFEKNGWTGLLVEPHPETFKTLLGKNRKAFAFNGGLSITGGFEVMNLTMQDCAIYAGDGQCSHLTRDIGNMVQLAPVDQLLACLGRSTVDLWSLDVEGVEADILKHVNLREIEVGVLLIEMNKNDKNNEGIERVMKENSFQECGRTQFDRIYINPSYFTKRKLQSPVAC